MRVLHEFSIDKDSLVKSLNRVEYKNEGTRWSSLIQYAFSAIDPYMKANFIIFMEKGDFETPENQNITCHYIIHKMEEGQRSNVYSLEDNFSEKFLIDFCM